MTNVNKMKELVGIFGKEIGEEFNIIGRDGEYLPYNPYKFTEEALIDKDGHGADPIIIRLIRGVYTVESIPFTPKLDL